MTNVITGTASECLVVDVYHRISEQESPFSLALRVGQSQSVHSVVYAMTGQHAFPHYVTHICVVFIHSAFFGTNTIVCSEQAVWSKEFLYERNDSRLSQELSIFAVVLEIGFNRKQHTFDHDQRFCASSPLCDCVFAK